MNGFRQLPRPGHPRALDENRDHPDLRVVLERKLDLPAQHVVGNVEASTPLLVDGIEPPGPDDDKHGVARSELALKRLAVILARFDLDVDEGSIVTQARLEVVLDRVDRARRVVPAVRNEDATFRRRCSARAEEAAERPG
jgi:hypothetical protein